MKITRNWLLIGALTLAAVGCSGDDDDVDSDKGSSSGGVAGSSPGSGGNNNGTSKVGPNTLATGGISTAGKGFGGNVVNVGGSGANPSLAGAAGAPRSEATGGQTGHAGEPPRGAAGTVSASGGASVGGAKAIAGAAGRVATNGCGRVRYTNLDATGANTDAVQDVLDSLEDRLLVCNQQEFARDDSSEAQFTLRIVIDEDGDATTTIRNRTDASDAFFDCILPIYRSADWSDLRRLEEASATVRFRTGDC